ncbi:MAG TPA: hypothetical protein PKD26_02730 [Pyrinomonadaceae bacterium]|nr:hypothetical protein [Pyrinomonadaceae bacterium]
MDVYHKILTRIYEVTGGKDTVEVDLNDLLKQEGFFSNIDNISQHLLTESWVAETPRPRVVKITHWGTAEAKRVINNKPDTARELTKDANRLLADSRELVIMLEEFAASPSAKHFETVKKRIDGINGIVADIKEKI